MSAQAIDRLSPAGGESVGDSEPLRTLKSFFGTPRAPQGSLSLLALDGYLTAVAVAPDIVMPGDMLSGIWGDAGLQSADGLEAQTIAAAVMARHNQIDQQIDESELQPLFQTELGDRPLHERVSEWANGFWNGMMRTPDEWRDLLRQDEVRSLLAPIVCFVIDRDGQPLVDPEREEIKGLVAVAHEFIPSAVLGLRRRYRREATTVSPRRTQRIGRNEPCPCGSGRKYKRCCGQ